MTEHTTSNETSCYKAPQWGDLPDEETTRAPDTAGCTDNMTTAMEVDEQENEIILARLGAATRGISNHRKSNDLSKANLNNYTSAAMPDIHDEAPLTLLEGISKEQLLAWLQTATGKVLV